ncbi:MAG: hypothetical protein IGS50_05645 [Synechococcales cyanobacterium C42_A2020_086]|jgi:hypothetical protein|nr:hypothetical protein [Synechococcales cyanobacterium C42_A2020_086]
MVRQRQLKQGFHRFHQWLQLAVFLLLAISMPQLAVAQSEIRRGILPVSRLEDWQNQEDITISSGFLVDLQNDPNFDGDYTYIEQIAAGILEGYTVVNRAGYFPENAGIPRDQQLALAQAVYYFYLLPNGNGLILYRSPTENTSRYMIRRPGVGFLLR